MMNRLRTLIATALLTIPVLTLAAPGPVDLSTRIVRESQIPAPEGSYCFVFNGHIYCI